eukprot:jgi/Tetstr1/445456/TSEL_033235.t1
MRTRCTACLGCNTPGGACIGGDEALTDSALAWKGPEPLERRLEQLLTTASKMKESGNRLYGQRRLLEALRAYETADEMLQPVAHHDILPEFQGQWRAIMSTIPANMAAVFMELGQLEDAAMRCTFSLLVMASAKVYVRRGKARESLGRLGMALGDYQEAARLGQGSGEAQRLLEGVMARLGSDSQGCTRYQWQKEWADAEAPENMQGLMMFLLARQYPGRVPWGELNTRPGRGSDLRWDSLSSPFREIRSMATMQFQKACVMLAADLGGTRWGDKACAIEWLLHMQQLGCTLGPEGLNILGIGLIWGRVWPGDASKGEDLLQRSANGEHDHPFCDQFLQNVEPGGGMTCVLQMPAYREQRGHAIVTLGKLQEIIRGSAALQPMPARRLKALYKMGANELMDNRVQLLFADSYVTGYTWATDARKFVKWLEVCAANPQPIKLFMGGAMARLASALAMGMGGEVEVDLDRAEALAKQAMRLDPEMAESATQTLSIVANCRRNPSYVEEHFNTSSSGNASRCQKCGTAAASSTHDGDGEAEVVLLKCRGCRRVVYCSKECQRADWKEHKKVCKA